MVGMLVVNRNKAGIIDALEKIVQLNSMNMSVDEIILKEVDGEAIPLEFAEDLLKVKIKKPSKKGHKSSKILFRN